jgi:hypothetical protein
VSTPQSRDRSLEHLLRRHTPAVSAVTPACADSETLAAWIDGGLDAQAMAETERHLSNCGRCQTMLAAIVRSEPDAPAVLPWWSRMHLRWMVPLTAAAAATVLWMVVPGARQDLTVVRPEATQARADRSDAADAAVPAPGPSIGSAGAEPSPRAAAEPPSASARAGQPAPARMGNESRKTAPSADQERTAPSDKARPGASAENRAREEVPAERQGLAKQQPADTLARSNERKQEALKESAGVTGVTPAAESPQAARVAPSAPAAPAAVAGAVAGFAGGSAAAVPSRDGVARWRLAAPGPSDLGARTGFDGTIERSDDGGGTWQQVSTGIRGRFTAGVAPSATVCWLVGPGGTVALTTDARTWRQLAAPAPDADLASVEASDARTATVRDTQGRTFRTTDGGASWTRLP